MRSALLILLVLSLLVATAQAKLSVEVAEPKQTASKVVVKLTVKNQFAEKVESARATIFLMDAQGKVVGQATQWVIGGTTDRPELKPDATATYNFVITTDKSFTKAQLLFNRVILEAGKVAEPQGAVEITYK